MAKKKINKKGVSEGINEKQRNEKQISIIAEKKLLTEAPKEHHFHLADGTQLGTVLHLMEALGSMHDDTYAFHANAEKNDFSAWVKDCFQEEDLAQDLKSANNRKEAELAIARRLLKELL